MSRAANSCECQKSSDPGVHSGLSFPTICIHTSTARSSHHRHMLRAISVDCVSIRPAESNLHAQVSSAHNAFDWFGNSTGGPAVVPHTTADIMGISSALQCKNVLQPKQAEGIKRSSDTPALTERVHCSSLTCALKT